MIDLDLTLIFATKQKPDSKIEKEGVDYLIVYVSRFNTFILERGIRRGYLCLPKTFSERFSHQGFSTWCGQCFHGQSVKVRRPNPRQD